MNEQMIKETIAKNIVTYRKHCNLTQAQLAEKINYSDKAVSKWERELCYPDIFLLPDISNILGISIDEMMGAQCCKGKR